MTAPEDHFRETKKILQSIPKDKIGVWLLNEGYYPEQYIVPPCFQVKNVSLHEKPYFSFDKKSKITPTDLEKISFPKSNLIDRTFGIYDYKKYHDIVWHIIDQWTDITELLFNENNKIYHYSFPIPITSKEIGELGYLRSGRMIYEYIEMAENDLLKESYNFEFILKTDIANFYQSIYTHSIAWAIHSKGVIRDKENRYNNQLIGNNLDILIRNSNDGCTNGIPIGPAISDLIAEIVLSATDQHASNMLINENIEFIGVRYKDDYRFLCHSQDDAQKIIKILQRSLSEFHLTLNEGKSTINILPEGLFRTWKLLYQKHSLARYSKISYRLFESTILHVMEINKSNPGTGVIDKFLSELTNSKNLLKLKISEQNIHKVISLLIHLKERRSKVFPQILAIIEAIYNDSECSEKIKTIICSVIKEHFDRLIEHSNANLYEVLWLSYFSISNNLFLVNLPDNISSRLLLSIKNSKQQLCSDDFNIYQNIQPYSPERSLLEYLKVFNRSKKNR